MSFDPPTSSDSQAYDHVQDADRVELIGGAVVSGTVDQGTGGLSAWLVQINGVPLNRRTLVTGGAQAKDMTNVTPTGLTNALTVKFGSALNGGSSIPIAFLATQAGAQAQSVTNSVENFDGGLIVPPGGILTLVCGTTPVGHSAASAIVWEEVPL